MPLKVPRFAAAWTDALPRAWRRLLPFVVVLAALAAALPSARPGHDPLRQAGWERQHGEPAVLREPETVRILRREAPDNRDRGGPGGDDSAARPSAPRLAADLSPAAAAPVPPATPAYGRRTVRPEPRAPPALSAA
ncbi:hypothetical protein ACJ4V0_11980 [Phreatobacter sp. HK31-P]